MESRRDRSLSRAQRAALARIEGLMEYWQIGLHELGDLPLVPPPPPAPPVKYRHPKTGDTWDGLGPHPDWLRHALLKEGYTVAELSPANQAPAEAPAAAEPPTRLDSPD
ncbi:H-NS family nucleoid-associated regulatory protein [Ideonella sp. A 288]|uniref:H-NS family nucleoid-associated regulatory protein n=1 Tax=Ideonella sp. A 288 TaxID=1962181 RepID=UPI000B4BAED0|nr:H-NS family nucleoid-associated regulatory protein [Ideonella sp. A 288]